MHASKPKLVVALLAALAACSPAPVPANEPVVAPASAIAPACAEPASVATPQASRPSSDVQREATELVGSILVAGRSLAYATDLTERHGPRLTGSKVATDAGAWAVAAFKAAGVDSARLEAYPIEHTWARGHATATVAGKGELHVTSAGWSPPTPRGGLDAEIAIVDDLSPAALRGRAAELQGRIVLVPWAKVLAGGFGKGTTRMRAAWPEIVAAGAVALLVAHGRPMNVVKAHWHLAPSFVAPLPTFDIGLEDATALRRLAARGPTRLHLGCDNVVGPPAESANVIADLPGSAAPEEIVLVGAHLDAWDFATGAQDDGTGVAMVLEAARAINALGKRPRRTLRFALWTGEEQGLLGSRAYAARHAAELDRHVAVLNTDSGAGLPLGFMTFGVPPPALEPVLDGLLAGLGATSQKPLEGCGSDECTFVRRGVPTLDLLVDDTRYLDVHHLSSDTIDKVDPRALAVDAAALAVAAWSIANREPRLAPRVTASELPELLHKADIDPEAAP